MFCTKCGNRLEDTATVCSHCGGMPKKRTADNSSAPVASATIISQTSAIAQPPFQINETPKATKKKSALKKLLVFCSFLVVLSGIGYFVIIPAINNTSYENQLLAETEKINNALNTYATAIEDLDIDLVAKSWDKKSGKTIKSVNDIFNILPFDIGSIATSVLSLGTSLLQVECSIEPIAPPEFSSDFTQATQETVMSFKVLGYDAYQKSVTFVMIRENGNDSWLISSQK